MPQGKWKDPATIALAGNAFFAYRLCWRLIENGAMTAQEAAGIMTGTADDIRTGSEQGEGRALGEATARSYEKLAARLLGAPLDP